MSDTKKPLVLEYQETLNKQIKSLSDTIFHMSTTVIICKTNERKAGEIIPLDSINYSLINGGSDIDADTIKTLVDTELKLMRAVLSLEGVDIPLEYPEGTHEDDVKQVETAEERNAREEEKGFYS